jgi:uncharacterized protein
VIASDWAGGFLDAVALRAEAWQPLMEDDDARMLMVPLLLLNGDLDFDDSGHDEDAFLAEAPDIIPACVAAIHQFWRQRSQEGGNKVGRERRKKGGSRRR